MLYYTATAIHVHICIERERYRERENAVSEADGAKVADAQALYYTMI